jgi:dienelactone hydrolase
MVACCMRLAAVVLAAGAVALAGAAGAVEQVTIPHGETALPGILFRPEGPGPFPGAVALHGCGGLVNRSGQIVARFADWGERLAAAGVAVLFPDSFSPRGLATQCRVRERKVRSSRERVADANEARRWLQNQPWTVKNRISLIGWSTGASTSLWTVRPRAAVRDGLPDFRSAVAFYPGCRRLGDIGWSTRIPTLILIGRADDWTSAVACEQMVAGARGRSAGATLVTYPGAYHEFDRPDYPVRELTGLAFTADGNGHAHVGTNPAARADAIKRVPEWLAR